MERCTERRARDVGAATGGRSVSYTHLDVYKRQLYGSRVEKMIEIFLGDGDLEEGEGISLSPDTMQPSYLIVSCRQYDGHRRAWGESL